ncbi:MAG: NAD(P)-dependent oxidoreductase [Sphingopyxis sp.]
MTSHIAITGAPSLSLAITGATGFVGQSTLDTALATGQRVTALTRRPQSPRDGLTWIEGALDSRAALDRLVEQADTVIHIAGAVNVPTRAAFAAANIAGTQAVIDAAKRAGVRRFVHVSSLAARHPGLSNYGWSKAEAEDVVTKSGLDYVVARPPAIYGPHDSDMFDLFRMARRGFMLLPPKGRTSIIHVEDLARLLIILATSAPPAPLMEPSDGTENGLTHAELAAMIGNAMGRPRLATLSAPRRLLHLAARADRLVRRDRARLTPDRASYLSHPDWVSMPQYQPPSDYWSPHWSGEAGLKMTADWYLENGWIT